MHSGPSFLFSSMVGRDGLPRNVHVSHILPGKTDGPPFRIHDPLEPGHTDIGCSELIHSLEAELAHTGGEAAREPDEDELDRGRTVVRGGEPKLTVRVIGHYNFRCPACSTFSSPE